MELYLFVSFASRDRNNKTKNGRKKHIRLNDSEIEELRLKCRIRTEDPLYKFVNIKYTNDKVVKMYAYNCSKRSKKQVMTEFIGDEGQASQQEFNIDQLEKYNLSFEEYCNGNTRSMDMFIYKHIILRINPEGCSEAFDGKTGEIIFTSQLTGQDSYFAGWINFKKNAKLRDKSLAYYVTSKNEISQIDMAAIYQGGSGNQNPKLIEKIIFTPKPHSTQIGGFSFEGGDRRSQKHLFILLHSKEILIVPLSVDGARPGQIVSYSIEDDFNFSPISKGCAIINDHQYLIAADCYEGSDHKNSYYMYKLHHKNSRNNVRLSACNHVEVVNNNSLLNGNNSVHSMHFFELKNLQFLATCNLFGNSNVLLINENRLHYIYHTQISPTDVLWTFFPRFSKQACFIINSGGGKQVRIDFEEVRIDNKVVNEDEEDQGLEEPDEGELDGGVDEN